MNTQMLLAVVVSLFVCQQVHAQFEDNPVMPEATELEGTWEIMSYVHNGERVELDGFLWRHEGDRRYYRPNGDDVWVSAGTYSVDPSATPAEIVIRSEIATMRGVYKIDDDLLTICLGFPGAFEEGTGPEGFESSEEIRTILAVFRRVEEDDE